MALVFAQFIGSGVVAQPCQFEAESRLPVAQINQYEASVARFLAVCFFQAQRLVVKFETASEVGDVDVEMSNLLLISIITGFSAAQNYTNIPKSAYAPRIINFGRNS